MITDFNFGDFFAVFVPQYVGGALGSNASAFNQQKLCALFGRDADAVSFSENALNFANYMQTLMTKR